MNRLTILFILLAALAATSFASKLRQLPVETDGPGEDDQVEEALSGDETSEDNVATEPFDSQGQQGSEGRPPPPPPGGFGSSGFGTSQQGVSGHGSAMGSQGGFGMGPQMGQGHGFGMGPFGQGQGGVGHGFVMGFGGMRPPGPPPNGFPPGPPPSGFPPGPPPSGGFQPGPQSNEDDDNNDDDNENGDDITNEDDAATSASDEKRN